MRGSCALLTRVVRRFNGSLAPTAGLYCTKVDNAGADRWPSLLRFAEIRKIASLRYTEAEGIVDVGARGKAATGNWDGRARRRWTFHQSRGFADRAARQLRLQRPSGSPAHLGRARNE